MDKKIIVLHIAECVGGVKRCLQMLFPKLGKKCFYQYFICSFNYYDKYNYQGMSVCTAFRYNERRAA